MPVTIGELSASVSGTDAVVTLPVTITDATGTVVQQTTVTARVNAGRADRKQIIAKQLKEQVAKLKQEVAEKAALEKDLATIAADVQAAADAGG